VVHCLARVLRFRARVVRGVLEPLEEVELREGEVLEVEARSVEELLDDVVDRHRRELERAGEDVTKLKGILRKINPWVNRKGFRAVLEEIEDQEWMLA